MVRIRLSPAQSQQTFSSWEAPSCASAATIGTTIDADELLKVAEGDYVVGRWEGGGTHTGPAFSDFLIGSVPAASGRKMRFTGTTVLRVESGKIVEEIGLDAVQQRSPARHAVERTPCSAGNVS